MRNFYLVPSILCLCTAFGQADEKANRNWAQWRGPLSTGVAPNSNPPTEWSEKKNVRWKTPLVGKGHSTPIVWDDHIFVTSAVPFGEKFEPRYSGAPGAHDNLPISQQHQFDVFAYNRNDGKLRWRKTVAKVTPHEGAHYTGTLASQSSATDGENIYAFFGSFGLHALDFKGNIQWSRDFGDMNTKHGHGEGASICLYKDTLIVNWDHEGASFIAAVNTKDGKDRWNKPRDEVTSWSTPIVVEHEGKPQVIVSGTSRVRGYDLTTGNAIWECGGLSHNIVASPVSSDGMVYAGSSYEIRSLFAVKLDGARGDITGSDQVVWQRQRGTPYVPSPLLYGESLYFLRHYQGVLTRVIAKTGEEKDGPFRLSGITNVYASPVGAANRVYITDRNGTTMVISHDDSPKFLARNILDDTLSASIAIAGDEMFIRGERSLYCISEKGTE
ncbi:MAG: hypothetical protein CMJ78_07045 [Planctomycetaceae bacterium]|nr:hypothetical protein [Planctomycetaceae bacterium]